MPRFYFHVKTPHGLIRDDVGPDLTGSAEARQEAEIAARQLIAEAARRGCSAEDCSFEIDDGNGRRVLSYAFEDALQPIGCLLSMRTQSSREQSLY